MKQVLYILFAAMIMTSCMDRGNEGNKDVPFDAPMQDPAESFPVETNPAEDLKEEPPEDVERAKENIKEYYDQNPSKESKSQQDFLEKMSRQIEKQEKEDIPDSLQTPMPADTTDGSW